MQKLFNLLASATIIILLSVIFWPKTTVSAKIKSQVDSIGEINEALEGHAYDKLGYDDTNGIFKIYYQCTGPGLCGTSRVINIPVDLEEITVE